MGDMEKFRVLGISDRILAALEKKGFEEPSPIQSATIPLLLSGEKDVIGQAQTGTGKTAAFGIPIIELLEPRKGCVQAVILAPTRELAIQIAEEMNSLRGDKGMDILPIYGGQSIEIQLSRLKRGVDVVVGTPGRVMDLMERRALDLSKVSFAVLDEADEMLNMGFVEDIESILARTGSEKRMLMFSATMPEAILTIAQKFMREYEVVRVKQQQLTTNLTEQIYFEVRREDKFEALTRIIDMETDFYAMVFCRTKNDVDELSEKLVNRGYGVEALHGDISQPQRTKVIERFKRRNFNILIATDVAARGIDVNNLTHVINYSIPQDPESYIHRIGRTGRAGKEGTAITFVTPAEYRKLTQIQRWANADIRREQLPRAADIVKNKKVKIKECLAGIIEAAKHDDCLEFADDLLISMEPRDIMAALLKFTFKEELTPEKYGEIGAPAARCAVDRKGTARLFVALGKNDGYNPKRILDMIWDKAKVKGYRIGKINCYDTFSFVTVPFGEAEIILDAFHQHGHGGAPLIEIAREKHDAIGAAEGAGSEAAAPSGYSDRPSYNDRPSYGDRPSYDRSARPPRKYDRPRDDRPREARPPRDARPAREAGPERKPAAAVKKIVPEFGDEAIIMRAMKKMRSGGKTS